MKYLEKNNILRNLKLLKKNPYERTPTEKQPSRIFASDRFIKIKK